ncbi:MAG: radical SAM protein [Candidatus Nanohaloarchaeota archaeon QJJ-9]|nr:radical SAM protein [Candidatus Nanohaloarchaeota archaeon QJJ-9]
MDLEVAIVDGYVDEPAHHGAPPYISTYPRYVSGALVDSGISRDSIKYYTIDQIRDDSEKYRKAICSDLLIVVTGMAVPVNSVGGDYMERDEMDELASKAQGTTLIGGPVQFGVLEKGGEVAKGIPESFDFVAEGDIEAAVFDLVHNDLEGFNKRQRSLDELERWSKKGAFIVQQHPNHPDYIITEVKIGRGCPFNCSFCIEPLYGKPTFRNPEKVVEEVKALNSFGINDFRLQAPNFLTYGGDGVHPNPEAMEKLYSGINEAVNNLETLHLDNFNANVIVNYPEKSRRCLETIAKYNTPGDTCSLGLESADSAVQEANNLTISNQECMEAVEMINEIGGFRVNNERSLPKLLPGINFVFGLKGQTEGTFEKNFDFLKKIYDKGLMLRRINLRQVSTHPGTEMYDFGNRLVKEHKSLFHKWKERIRKKIDNPMLERVAPPGTVIRNVYAEYHEGKKTFARPLGSYPLLIGLNEKYEIGSKFDVAVTDYGYRSISGVKYPLDPNSASMNELSSVPGVGQKRAGKLVINQPYDSLKELTKILEEKSLKFFEL